MPKESKLEFKVGLFVLIAVIALSVFILSVNDASYFKEGKSVKVLFGFADGLKEAAPVRIAGVQQGMIKNIQLFFDREDSRTKVEVELWIDKDTKVPADSLVVINQLGLLGEKYIEVIPGIDRKNFWSSGDVIIGKDPLSQESMKERVMEVADKAEEIIAGVSRIINDENNVESISTTLKNFSLASGNLNHILEDMKKGEGTVGKFLYDDRVYDDIQGFTSDLKANPWKLLYRPK